MHRFGAKWKLAWGPSDEPYKWKHLNGWIMEDGDPNLIYAEFTSWGGSSRFIQWNWGCEYYELWTPNKNSLANHLLLHNNLKNWDYIPSTQMHKDKIDEVFDLLAARIVNSYIKNSSPARAAKFPGPFWPASLSPNCFWKVGRSTD